MCIVCNFAISIWLSSLLIIRSWCRMAGIVWLAKISEPLHVFFSLLFWFYSYLSLLCFILCASIIAPSIKVNCEDYAYSDCCACEQCDCFLLSPSYEALVENSIIRLLINKNVLFCIIIFIVQSPLHLPDLLVRRHYTKSWQTSGPCLFIVYWQTSMWWWEAGTGTDLFIVWGF